jgi:DNA polymerase III subunit delta'
VPPKVSDAPLPAAPLIGHDALRARLADSADHDRLPAAMLLHGRAGVGKQRLALWLAQRLLCQSETGDRLCRSCQSCKFAAALTHPDLRWVFPRPRLKDADASPADVMRDLAEGAGERLADGLVYAPPAGTEGIYVATIRAIVRQAGITPAMSRRKVFVIGDAERMVSQEGADQAANAFLKLLEEPLPDTTIILTSSEPGALLPTIRSRVVAVRVPALADADVRSWLRHPTVSARLDALGVTGSEDDRIKRAAGAPGTLLAGTHASDAMDAARLLLRADRTTRYRRALKQGAAGARGAFSDTLDALTVLVHERAREAANKGDADAAHAADEGMRAIERAKTYAESNVNPQLITAELLRAIK